jgi:glycosyltransferase involved in cell wall biosynthesis
MKILICSMQVPFLRGGGTEFLVESLRRQLVAAHHQVDVVQMPLNWQDRAGLLQGYLSWRTLDLSTVEGERVDLLIATKFPSFVAPHDNKVTWLVQQFRQLYDLYGTQYSPYGHCETDGSLQRIVHAADTRALAESRRLFAISKNVARRLAQYNGLQAEVLYPPTPYDGLLYHESYGDYVLALSRLNVMKRVELLVRAMAHTQSGARCLIAGTGPEEAALRKLIRQKGLEDRVRLLGYVPDEEVPHLYANALAVYYAPYDEDYGFSTVEGFQALKPVLTANDSGGALEFVEDGVTGAVVPADDPRALADAIDRLYRERSLCRRLGSAGSERVRGIRWQTTLPRLLER